MNSEEVKEAFYNHKPIISKIRRTKYKRINKLIYGLAGKELIQMAELQDYNMNAVSFELIKNIEIDTEKEVQSYPSPYTEVVHEYITSAFSNLTMLMNCLQSEKYDMAREKIYNTIQIMMELESSVIDKHDPIISTNTKESKEENNKENIEA